MPQPKLLVDLCKNDLRRSMQDLVDEARRRRRLEIDLGWLREVGFRPLLQGVLLWIIVASGTLQCIRLGWIAL